MTRSALIGFLLLALLGAPQPARAHDDAAPPKRLGTVAFANSCAPDAQESFERGVALLHSFAFIAGEQAFREALAHDPACAIATWGIATVLVGNTFAIGPIAEEAQRAFAAIERGRAIGAKTERERDYIEAIGAYYDHFGERLPRRACSRWPTPSKLWPTATATTTRRRSSARCTSPPLSRLPTRAMRPAVKAAAILEAQFARHPDHPGVAHYLIHSYDYPPIAQKGLPAALCYADIAPDASHALHMPSHIFTRVGAWRELIDTNARSIASAMAENNLGSVLHAMDYTVYADLQLARDAAAEVVVKEAGNISTPAVVSLYARAAIPARYAVERGQWTEAAALDDPPDSKFPYTEAMTLFARAVGAARSGDPAAAEKDVVRLAAIAAALNAAKNDYWSGEVEVQRLGAAAWIAFAAGKRDEALGLMRAAADREAASEKSAISPGRILPARELLGDMLLESGSAEDALAAYEAALVNDPKRLRSLYGAGRAAAAAGSSDKARYYFSRIVDMADADSTRPEMIRAREYLAGK